MLPCSSRPRHALKPRFTYTPGKSGGRARVDGQGGGDKYRQYACDAMLSLCSVGDALDQASSMSFPVFTMI